jgi:hypothetical protein
MATIEQENKTKQELIALLAEIAKIKANDLVRVDLGKDLNFETGIGFFERTLNLFYDLQQSNLDNVSYTILNQLKERAANALDNLKKFKCSHCRRTLKTQ